MNKISRVQESKKAYCELTIVLENGYSSNTYCEQKFLSPAPAEAVLRKNYLCCRQRAVMGSFDVAHHSSTSQLPQTCRLVLTWTHLMSESRHSLENSGASALLTTKSMVAVAGLTGSSGRMPRFHLCLRKRSSPSSAGARLRAVDTRVPSFLF